MKLRHVVLFGFGKAQSPAAIAEVIRRFAELEVLVPSIDDFEWGENSSPEGLDHGHSHVFLLTFANPQTRDAYLVHPDHAAFANWVQPFVSSVAVSGLFGGKQHSGRFRRRQERFGSITSYIARMAEPSRSSSCVV
jgi:hypothetical protein